MDALQDLLVEIQRLQCLVCASQPERPDLGGLTPTRELLDRLRLTPPECDRLVRALVADGLCEAVPDPVHPLARGIRLTDSGRRYLQQWSDSVAGDHPVGGAAA